MLVSIYMPTKNRLDMLKAAVESVRNQTYENVELIVVDEASTDGTAEYLKTISEVDPRVKFFRNEVSMGACYARNLAIKASKGEFVTGLDDDDEFKSNHISALVDYWHLLAKHLKDEVSCLYTQSLARNGNSLRESRKMNRIECHDLFSSNCIGNQIFAPRTHYFEAGLFDEQMPAWQDLEFFYRLLKKFGTARLLDLPTYVFDTTPRLDRISIGQKSRISKACQLMIRLHAQDNTRNSQKLLLQIYADHYGFPVSISDVFRFARRGIWLRGYYTIIKKFIRIKLRRV